MKANLLLLVLTNKKPKYCSVNNLKQETRKDLFCSWLKKTKLRKVYLATIIIKIWEKINTLNNKIGDNNANHNMLLNHPKVFNWTSDPICCYTIKGALFRNIVFDKPVEFYVDEAKSNKKQIIDDYNRLLRETVPINRIPNPVVYDMEKVNKPPKEILKKFSKRSEFKIVCVPIKNSDVHRPVLTANNKSKFSKNKNSIQFNSIIIVFIHLFRM